MKRALTPEAEAFRAALASAQWSLTNAKEDRRNAIAWMKVDPMRRMIGGLAPSCWAKVRAVADFARHSATVKRLKAQGKLVQGIDYFGDYAPWKKDWSE